MLSIPRGTDFLEARRLIDEEQRNCEKRLLLLKMQRNTCTDVAKLPDEVLLDIFMVLNKDTEADFWFPLTHVCRHWRWVAIQLPKLWTKLPTHCHDLTLLFLERSKPLGLDVFFGARTSRDTVIAVSRDIQRIQTLFVGKVDHFLLSQMQEFLLDLGHEASMLKVLHISPPYSRAGKLNLSASTFGRLFLLQKLTLQSIDFEWTMLPLPNLTSLSIAFMRNSNSSSPSLENLFHILASMPRLKKIRLNLRQLQHHTISRNINPFPLSHLASLHIEFSSEAEILAFISTVTMPVLEQVDMFCDTLEDRDDYSTTVRIISSMIEQGNFKTFDNLYLDESSFTLSTLSENPEKHVTFGHEGTLTENGAVRFLMDLLSGISALIYDGHSTLKWVNLGSYPAPSSTRIVELFAALPLLESITIWDDTIIPFLNGLSVPTLAMEDAQITFPGLKSIIFQEEEYLYEETVFCSEVFDILRDCLTRRCDYNAPIDKLTIPWKISEKEFRSLKEVVVTVDFDYGGGIEG